MATVNLGRVVGYSAYEVAVNNGYVGTEEEWLASLKGKDGKDGTITLEELTPEQKASLKGDKGEAGPEGPRGYTPIKGVDYFDGETGPEGPKGEAFKYEDFTPEQLEALRGPKGEDGAPGETGPQGPEGPKGEDAVLPSFKTINGEEIIGEGDIEISGGGANYSRYELDRPLADFRYAVNVGQTRDTCVKALLDGKVVYNDFYRADVWPSLLGEDCIGYAELYHRGNSLDFTDSSMDPNYGCAIVNDGAYWYLAAGKPKGTGKDRFYYVYDKTKFMIVCMSKGVYTHYCNDLKNQLDIQSKFKTINGETITGSGDIVISGGGEPDAYIKSASVDDNTLILTNKDDTTISYSVDTSNFATHQEVEGRVDWGTYENLINRINELENRITYLEGGEEPSAHFNVMSRGTDGDGNTVITFNGLSDAYNNMGDFLRNHTFEFNGFNESGIWVLGNGRFTLANEPVETIPTLDNGQWRIDWLNNTITFIDTNAPIELVYLEIFNMGEIVVDVPMMMNMTLIDETTGNPIVNIGNMEGMPGNDVENGAATWTFDGMGEAYNAINVDHTYHIACNFSGGTMETSSQFSFTEQPGGGGGMYQMIDATSDQGPFYFVRLISMGDQYYFVVRTNYPQGGNTDNGGGSTVSGPALNSLEIKDSSEDQIFKVRDIPSSGSGDVGGKHFTEYRFEVDANKPLNSTEAYTIVSNIPGNSSTDSGSFIWVSNEDGSFYAYGGNENSPMRDIRLFTDDANGQHFSVVVAYWL